MERCPTCRARYSGGESCHRCQTDLRQVLAIEETARHHRQQARAALQRGCVQESWEQARFACYLHRSSASVKSLALAALADRDFGAALELWCEYRQLRSAGEA